MIWNARGTGNASFIRSVKTILIVIIWIFGCFFKKIGGSQAINSIFKIGWSGIVKVDPIGFSGGIWLLWKEEVSFDILSSSN